MIDKKRSSLFGLRWRKDVIALTSSNTIRHMRKNKHIKMILLARWENFSQKQEHPGLVLRE